MNIFKKTKQTKTDICIKTLCNIFFNEENIEQVQYITDNYVYTEAGGNKIIFLQEKNKQYTVNIDKNELKELDFSTQMIQINQIKTMIGELNINEVTEKNKRRISIQNNAASQVVLDVNLDVIEFPELEKTAFSKFNESQESMQLFSPDLKANEFVKSSKSNFIFNGQEQKTNLELLEINLVTENIEKFDYISNFKIVK